MGSYQDKIACLLHTYYHYERTLKKGQKMKSPNNEEKETPFSST